MGFDPALPEGPLKPQVAVIDVDDTLFASVRAHAAYLSTLTRRLSDDSGLDERLVRQGFRQLFRERGLYDMREAIRAHPQLTAAFPGEDLTQRFKGALADAQAVFAATARPPEDVVDTLDRLKRQGVRLIAYSEGGAADTVWKLQSVGLDQKFERIYAPRDQRADIVPGQHAEGPPPRGGLWDRITLVPRFPKSSPDTLVRIVRDQFPNEPFEEARRRVVMVGDNAVRDVMMAEQAGIAAVYTRQFRRSPLERFGEMLAVAKRAPPGPGFLRIGFSTAVKRLFFTARRSVDRMGELFRHIVEHPVETLLQRGPAPGTSGGPGGSGRPAAGGAPA